MPSAKLRRHPLDIVTACRAADLRTLPLTCAALRKYVPFRQLHVITARANFPKLRSTLGEEVALVDEDTFIPGMTLESLRQLPLTGFPAGAGWYFQQLLKFQFCFSEPSEDYYLIWDADTVPLRPLEFFDEKGAMLYTVTDERHAPYFETYTRLLGEDARPDFSFITQHIPVQKSILREMLSKIAAHLLGEEHWAWKIMHNLEGASYNLFSEYEMFGYYVKHHYPEAAAYRRLPWLREGSQAVGGMPSSEDLDRLGKDYAFAAFEAKQRFPRRWAHHVRSWFHR